MRASHRKMRGVWRPTSPRQCRGRLRGAIQQRGGGHDHSSLAIAALGHVFRDPRALTRVIASSREAFDGGVRLSVSFRQRDLTRPNGVAALVDGTGAAYSHAAAVLGSLQSQDVAENPNKGISAGAVTSCLLKLTVMVTCGMLARDLSLWTERGEISHGERACEPARRDTDRI
jgi:hypothetical protein